MSEVVVGNVVHIDGSILEGGGQRKYQAFPQPPAASLHLSK